jgi:flavin-dependent dehydrogenase
VRRTAALIVGGGPAGASAAISLARGGTMPVLIERTTGERDVVCGGFLGWDAVAALGRLGIDPAELGAQPIHRLRLVAGAGRHETDLPRAGAGLSRRRLDATLLQVAEQQGAVVLRGRAVRAVEDGRVRMDDGEEMDPEALFVATGKHELRGVARQIGGRGVSVGLRAALPPNTVLTAALAGTIELHLFDGGYAGLLLQEDGSTNLCLSVSAERLAGAGGRDALIAQLVEDSPLLGERIGTAPPDHWEAIAGVPYGWKTATTAPGQYRVGDQAAVIASLAGDGIAIALTSGAAAAHACLHGDSAGSYQAGFAWRAARPLAVAQLLRHMAERPVERQAMMGLAKVPGLASLAARMTRIG